MQLVLGICVALIGVVIGAPDLPQCFPRASYPTAFRDESIVDDYFGVKVKDPYRWLEKLETSETKKFIESENKITRPYLDGNRVKREINEELTQVWNFPKYSTPVKAGNKYFYLKNSGLENQNVLYVQDALNGTPHVFLDPNALSQDSSLFLTGYEFSNDGETLAYGLGKMGSDWITIRFKDVKTGKDYPEILEYIKYTKMAWAKDNTGFFYSRYFVDLKNSASFGVESTRDQKLYYHRLNTPQSEDILIFEYPQEPTYRISSVVSDDGNYLIVYVSRDAFGYMVFYADLSAINFDLSKKLQFIPLMPKLEAKYKYITNQGSSFIFRTNKNAPNFKLVSIDLKQLEEKYWTELIPEQKLDVLEAAYAVAGDKLIVHYISDVKSRLQLHDLKTGKMLEVINLGVGYMKGFFGKKSQNEVFFQFTSFFTPGLVYYMDFKKQPCAPVVFLKSEVQGFNPSLFESRQVFYPSKDGTKISMFILYKKGLVQDSSNPVLLTASGSYEYSVLPNFDVFHLVFMKNFDGVVAIPNIRGGGESGGEWQAAGSLLNTQNALDDLQAAAEFLVAEKYTKPSLITLYGKTSGALLVAASINQRPDLFGAAIIRKGFLDMLRYHKFSSNAYWTSIYGSSNDQTQFLNLMKYSPLHNVRTPIDHRYEYPATLVIASDLDKKVHPGQSLKYIATLQNAVKDFRQYRPLMVNFETSGVKSTTKRIDKYTDILSFMSRSMDLKFKK